MDDEALAYGSYKKIKLSISGSCGGGGQIVKSKTNDPNEAVCVQRSKGNYDWQTLTTIFESDSEDIQCDWDSLDLALTEAQKKLDITLANLKSKRAELDASPITSLFSFDSFRGSVKSVLDHRDAYRRKLERVSQLHDSIKALNESHVATFAARGKRMTPWT